MKNIMPSQAKALLQPGRDMDRASIYENKANPGALFQIVELDLTDARTDANPYHVNFPFASVYIMDMESGVEINFKPNTRASGQQALVMSRKDVLNFERPISGAFLSHIAYPGVTVKIAFFLETRFVTGNIISLNAGGVSINDGASIDTSVVTLAAATAAELVAADTDRKVATIQNNTGASVWVGKSTVSNTGADKGIEIPAGQTIVWKNTAALSGYSVAGGDLVVLVES